MYDDELIDIAAAAKSNWNRMDYHAAGTAIGRFYNLLMD